MSRTTWLVALVVGVLGLAPCVAQADDPHISGMEAIVTTPAPPVPTVAYPFALDVTYDGSAPGWVRGSVFEWVDGDWSLLNDGCWYNGCVVGVEADSAEEIARPHDRRFKAVLYSEGREYDSAVLVVHERRLHYTIAVDFDSSPGYITTYIPNSMGGTDLSTVIHDDGSVATSCNVYWNYCNAEITTGHVYYASVEDEDGNVYGITPSYLATSSTTATKETANKVDLVRLGLVYPTPTDVCETLLTYQGTHFAESTVSDQELACETAVANRDTMSNLLRAVAAAGGGSSVLWWLMHDGTVSQLSTPTAWPDYELPATRDLPLVWQAPVINVADHYKLQERGKDLTAEAAEALSRACLWNVSRIGNAREDCANLPVFFSGSDVEEATEHDLEAIAGMNRVAPHPEWVKLNYEYGAGKERYQNRNWYRSVSPCDVRTIPAGQQCDEYPFWASEQGGDPALVPPPHLRFIDSTDNQYQGSRFGSFVTSCGLRSGPPPESGGNARGGDVFLMIPVPPDLDIPTTWLCNRD